MNTDGGGQTRLTFSTAWDVDPCLVTGRLQDSVLKSPNRRTREIFTMKADGTGQADITHNPASSDARPAADRLLHRSRFQPAAGSPKIPVVSWQDKRWCMAPGRR